MTSSIAPEIVFYEPPKGNSFGHGAKRRDPAKAWAEIFAFLNRNTIFSGPSRIELTAYGPNSSTDTAVANECISALGTLLGSPDNVSGVAHKWTGNEATFPHMLEFMLHAKQWPRQPIGPVRLQFGFDFFWRDPVCGELLAGQKSGHHTKDGTVSSNLTVFIESTVFIQPSFVFPFSYLDPQLPVFLFRIHPDLPFKFAMHHLRRAVPRKKTVGYRLLKFDTTMFATRLS